MSTNLLSTTVDQIVQDLTVNPIGEVRFMRKNTWPLILENITSCNSFSISAKQLSIPEFVLKEIFVILQGFGFIPWRQLSVWSDAVKFLSQSSIDHILGRTAVQCSNEEVSDITEFLKEFAQFPSVRRLSELNSTPKEFPFGLFRFTSLFDMEVGTFKSRKDFLDFLLNNIRQQEKIFWETFIESLRKNGWLPVDDIPEKCSLVLSDTGAEIFEEVRFKTQVCPLHMRLIPGFSPPGLLVSIGLELPTVWGEISSENICFTLWIRFEYIEGKTVPVIHTIQNFLHNIGIDTRDHKLISFPEGRPMGCERWLDKKEKFILIDSIEKKTWWNSLQVFLAIVCEMLFEFGYDEVQVIDGRENLWLMEHNPDRAECSINNSARSLYQEHAIAIGGRLLPNGRSNINRANILEFLSEGTRSLIAQKWFDAFARLVQRENLPIIPQNIRDGTLSDETLAVVMNNIRIKLFNNKIRPIL